MSRPKQKIQQILQIFTRFIKPPDSTESPDSLESQESPKLPESLDSPDSSHSRDSHVPKTA